MAPLTPAVMHVLLSLAGGERHGYAILKEVLLQTNHQVRLGWVEETDGPGGASDERRRYYRLSRSGREALKAEVERLDALVRGARARGIVPRASRG